MNNKQIKSIIVSMVLGVNLTSCKKEIKPVSNLDIQDTKSFTYYMDDISLLSLKDNREYNNLITNLELAFNSQSVYKEDNIIRNTDNTKRVEFREDENYITIIYTLDNYSGKVVFNKEGETLSSSMQEIEDDKVIEYSFYKVGNNNSLQYHYFKEDIGNLTIGLYAPYQVLKLSLNGSMVEIYLSNEELSNIASIMKSYGNTNKYLDFIEDNKDIIISYLEDLHIRKVYYLKGEYINPDSIKNYISNLNSKELSLTKTKVN